MGGPRTSDARRRCAVAAVLLTVLGTLLVGVGSLGPTTPGLAASDRTAPADRPTVEVVHSAPVAVHTVGHVQRRAASGTRGALAVLTVVAMVLVLIVMGSSERVVLGGVASRRHHRSPRGPPRV